MIDDHSLMGWVCAVTPSSRCAPTTAILWQRSRRIPLGGMCAAPHTCCCWVLGWLPEIDVCCCTGANSASNPLVLPYLSALSAATQSSAQGPSGGGAVTDAGKTINDGLQRAANGTTNAVNTVANSKLVDEGWGQSVTSCKNGGRGSPWHGHCFPSFQCCCMHVPQTTLEWHASDTSVPMPQSMLSSTLLV